MTPLDLPERFAAPARAGSVIGTALAIDAEDMSDPLQHGAPRLDVGSGCSRFTRGSGIARR